jgi:hypothetical protein
VTFEASTNGLNYLLIGSATRIAGGWQLTGVSLPRAQNIFIRARGLLLDGILGRIGLGRRISAQCLSVRRATGVSMSAWRHYLLVAGGK